MKHQKHHAILLLLIRGEKLTRFDAERHGDHCLNSTIPELEHKYGLQIHRERIKVPCRTGTVSCCSYSIPAKENRERAAQLLAAELAAKGRFKSEVDALASFGVIH